MFLLLYASVMDVFYSNDLLNGKPWLIDILTKADNQLLNSKHLLKSQLHVKISPLSDILWNLLLVNINAEKTIDGLDN